MINKQETSILPVSIHSLPLPTWTATRCDLSSPGILKLLQQRLVQPIRIDSINTGSRSVGSLYVLFGSFSFGFPLLSCGRGHTAWWGINRWSIEGVRGFDRMSVGYGRAIYLFARSHCERLVAVNVNLYRYSPAAQPNLRPKLSCFPSQVRSSYRSTVKGSEKCAIHRTFARGRGRRRLRCCECSSRPLPCHCNLNTQSPNEQIIFQQSVLSSFLHRRIICNSDSNSPPAPGVVQFSWVPTNKVGSELGVEAPIIQGVSLEARASRVKSLPCAYFWADRNQTQRDALHFFARKCVQLNCCKGRCSMEEEEEGSRCLRNPLRMLRKALHSDAVLQARWQTARRAFQWHLSRLCSLRAPSRCKAISKQLPEEEINVSPSRAVMTEDETRDAPSGLLIGRFLLRVPP
jgi:hypothetical protein